MRVIGRLLRAHRPPPLLHGRGRRDGENAWRASRETASAGKESTSFTRPFLPTPPDGEELREPLRRGEERRTPLARQMKRRRLCPRAPTSASTANPLLSRLCMSSDETLSCSIFPRTRVSLGTSSLAYRAPREAKAATTSCSSLNSFGTLYHSPPQSSTRTASNSLACSRTKVFEKTSATKVGLHRLSASTVRILVSRVRPGRLWARCRGCSSSLAASGSRRRDKRRARLPPFTYRQNGHTTPRKVLFGRLTWRPSRPEHITGENRATPPAALVRTWKSWPQRKLGGRNGGSGCYFHLDVQQIHPIFPYV